MRRPLPLWCVLALAACGDPVVDADGDGFPETEDCDDNDASVNPDAVEVCNGLDDDCDGTTDGEAAEDRGAWYGDADNDGYGDRNKAVKACDQPLGFVSNRDDCDDNDASVGPC